MAGEPYALEPGQALYIAPDGTAVPVAGPAVVAEAADGTETLISLPLGEAGKE